MYIIDSRTYWRGPHTLTVTKYCQIWQKMDTQICIKQITKIWTYSWQNHNLRKHNILLKSDRIILLEALQKKALKLAHKGSHSGISSMERCLRTHFFFHNMQSKVTDFANSCNDCKAFVDKKTRETIQQHKVHTAEKLGNCSSRSIWSSAFIQPYSCFAGLRL